MNKLVSAHFTREELSAASIYCIFSLRKDSDVTFDSLNSPAQNVLMTQMCQKGSVRKRVGFFITSLFAFVDWRVICTSEFYTSGHLYNIGVVVGVVVIYVFAHASNIHLLAQLTNEVIFSDFDISCCVESIHLHFWLSLEHYVFILYTLNLTRLNTISVGAHANTSMRF